MGEMWREKPPQMSRTAVQRHGRKLKCHLLAKLERTTREFQCTANMKASSSFSKRSSALHTVGFSNKSYHL